MAPDSLCVSRILPRDLSKILSLVARERLHARIQQGQKQLVSSVEDRLCAWEHDLAAEGLAKQSECSNCGGRNLTPMTATHQGRQMVFWCWNCTRFTIPTVRAGDYDQLPISLDSVPRIPPGSGESLRGAVSVADFEYLLGQLPNGRAPGQDGLPFELLRHAPKRMQAVVLHCINSILTGRVKPPRSWLGGMVRFLLKKEELALDTTGYRPVCLLDTTYKLLSAIVTDRLYRLSERFGLLDPSQEGFRRLCSTQRQVQSLHWALQEAAERRETVFCCYLDFANAFNSVDNQALWRWLREMGVPDVDLLESLYSEAYYQADLPYGRSASIALSRGQKQGDKSSPLLFNLLFNALLRALKATGVGHRTITGLNAPSRGFADDLVLVTQTATGMNRLLQVVAAFCSWSGMRIKREKSLISAVDYKSGAPLSTESVVYEGAPLSHLAATDPFPYLGIRASLISKGCRGPAPCLAAAKQHLVQKTREITTIAKHHRYLLGQMVPAMNMIATARFRYSAPLIAWTDAELRRLHMSWLQVHKAAWRLPPGYPSAPLMFPSVHGSCPVAHPVVHMVQALAKHVEQLVALPDSLRETTVQKYKRLCDSCGCHNERELTAYLAKERNPRACPLARLLRACGQLEIGIKLPACLSLGVAGRDTSWWALLVHLQAVAAAADAPPQLKSDVEILSKAWTAIRRRFKRRGVRVPRQLILDPLSSSAVWLIPERLRKDPAWLEPLRRALQVAEAQKLFPRISRAEGVPEVEVHQALLHDTLNSLRQTGASADLFGDPRWLQVHSSAPIRSWISVLNKQGFPCDFPRSEEAVRVNPVIDLTEIGQFAGATQAQLLALTLWLAPSIRTRKENTLMVDRGPLSWAPIHLSTERVFFDQDCLTPEKEEYGQFSVISHDGISKLESAGRLLGTLNQSRFKLLAEECTARRVDTEYLCEAIPAWIAYVTKQEQTRGISSHQFGAGLQVALQADGIIGCCPLAAPSAFPWSSWNGVTPDWGHQLQPQRPMLDLLCSSPDEQKRLLHHLDNNKVWFALTRRATLSAEARRTLERGGSVVHVYKRGSRVAACKGSFRTAQLRTVKSKEDWSLWASAAALRLQTHKGDLKRALAAVRLTQDGVVPLTVSDREARKGPAGRAYSLSGVVVATDGSLKKSGAMGAAMVAMGDKIQSRSVTVYGPPSTIRPELTGIALAVEECPLEEDLTILTDSLSAMQLLQSMQRRDFPLWLHRHTARHLLVQVVQRINLRAAAGSITRLLKVRAHRAEPLNEAADLLATDAAESDDSRTVAWDLDPEAAHFLFKEKWIEWDARVRESLVQRAAMQSVTFVLRRAERLQRTETGAQALPLTATWLLRPEQGRETLGRVLEEMQPSIRKKQILQSLAGAFPGNATLHRWGLIPSPACTLCGCPAETQSHIQCVCPALQEARIRAHHNLGQGLWRQIRNASKGWVWAEEATVEALQGLSQPEDQIDLWQRMCDEITDTDLEAVMDGAEEGDGPLRRKRPDAWAVKWGARKVLILEYTRPNDRAEDALQVTDAKKIARYTPLRDRMAQLLPGWTIEIQSFAMGIRGSYLPEIWTANLAEFGLKEKKIDYILCKQVAHTLVELTNLYDIRQAAVLQLSHDDT